MRQMRRILNVVGFFAITILLSSCFSYEYNLSPNENYIPNYKDHQKFKVHDNTLDFRKYSLHWKDPKSVMLFKLETNSKNEQTKDMDEVALINLGEQKINKIPDNQQTTLKNTFEETYYHEKVKEGAGDAVAEIALNTVFGGEYGMDTPFKGYIHTENGMGEYKISIEGNFIDYDDKPDRLELTFSSEKLGYNASFSFNSDDDDIPGKSYLPRINTKSYVKAMQASPTGRYVKLVNYLLDLKEGTVKKLHEQDATSVLSPDWSEIVFTRAKIIEEGGLFADHVDEHTLIVEKTAFNPQK